MSRTMGRPDLANGCCGFRVSTPDFFLPKAGVHDHCCTEQVLMTTVIMHAENVDNSGSHAENVVPSR